MKTRVLVAEDSITIRKRLIEVVTGDPALEFVAEAEDGKQAIELTLRLRPDVIALDMNMPVMSGLAATEYIMAHCPTPILIVSASTNRGELFRTYDALAAGAVDVLEKPLGDEVGEEWEQKFLSTLKLVSRIRVITHLRAKLVPTVRPRTLRSSPLPPPLDGPETPATCRAVAIGVSTGGPSAVLEVFRALPPTFPLPILLVIHIGEPFGKALAEWLDEQSPLRVRYARDGEVLPAPGQGGVLMAPPSTHLVLRAGRLHLTHGPERHCCRPSVDVLFESMALDLGHRGAACLLTGMGKDGAEGLLAIRRAGGVTLAQDEASSVVYGMPREAALLGAAERILPLEQFASVIASLARRGPAWRVP